MNDVKVLVDLPDKKNLKILKNGYVYYFTKEKWDSTKNMPVDDRSCIGKMSNVDNKMIPNKKYYEIFRELKEPGIFDDTLSIGSYFVFSKVSSIYNLIESLKRAFPKLYERILAYSIYMIDSFDSVSEHYQKWNYKNYSGLDYTLSPSQITELFKNITDSSIEEFFTYYIKSYEENNLIKNRNALAFDSTNQNTLSKNISYSEYGHAKKDKTKPIINSSYLVDETTGIPIFYETFFGSLLDKVETEYSISKMKSLGFKKLFLIMDRGYYSAKNLEKLKNESYVFLCPETLETTNKYIKEYNKIIKDDITYYLSKEKVYGIKIDTNNDFNIPNLKAYIFYDPIRALEEKDSILSKAEKLYYDALDNKYYSDELKDKYYPYLIIEKMNPSAKRSKPFITKNNEYLQDEINKLGMFVALSNEDISVSEMIKLVRERDRVEKVFRRLKTGLNLDKVGVYSDDTYRGKMFTAFIALNLIETYRYYIKDYFISHNNETFFTSISELEKIEMYKNKNTNKWEMKYALNKKSKDILSLLNLKDTDIIRFVKTIDL